MSRLSSALRRRVRERARSLCEYCHSFMDYTGRIVRLFNPRTNKWEDHFRWSPTFTRMIGRTAIGRATVSALRLNRLSIVRSRGIWVRHGLHPFEPQVV